MRPAPKIAIAVVAVVVLAAVWAFTPVRSLATPEELQKLIAPVADSPLLPLYTLAAFLVAGALFISVWLVIFQTGLLFPPLAAFGLSLAGALLSAAISYGVGRALGRDVVEKMAPARVRRAVEGAGLESIIAVRILPLLPFTLVNLCCGAFHVRFGVFVAGTVVGMVPGIIGMTLLGERLLATLKDPTPASVALLIGTAALVVGVAALLRRRASRDSRSGAARAQAEAAADVVVVTRGSPAPGPLGPGP